MLFLLLLLPHDILGQECCPKKIVGSDEYMYSYSDAGDVAGFGCFDSCVYLKNSDPNDKFCFAPGNLDVICDEDDSVPPTERDCFCGLANRRQRIVGGEVTEVNEYPWQVGLRNRGGDGVSWCGGSLIGDQWVLTAAHCTEDDVAEDIEVVLGEHDYRTDDEADHLVMSVAKIINHEKYTDEGTLDFDYALLKLSAPVEFTTHISPICLPVDDSMTYEGLNAIVSGWGDTEEDGEQSLVLKETTLTVINNTDCAERHNDTFGAENFIDEHLCTLGDGTDSCQGDSGGPLVTAVNGSGTVPGENYELIGVVSFGFGCARGTPDVFARVSSALEWIYTNIGGPLNTCPRVIMN